MYDTSLCYVLQVELDLSESKDSMECILYSPGRDSGKSPPLSQLQNLTNGVGGAGGY